MHLALLLGGEETGVGPPGCGGVFGSHGCIAELMEIGVERVLGGVKVQVYMRPVGFRRRWLLRVEGAAWTHVEDLRRNTYVCCSFPQTQTLNCKRC